MKNFKNILLSLILYFVSGCMFLGESGKINVVIKGDSKGGSSAQNQPLVSNISLNEDKLVLNGQHLEQSMKLFIDGEDLTIVSQNKTTVVLSAPKAITLALNSTLNLLMRTAYGDTIIPVVFNVKDKSITASKLESMGASTGQFLKYNGTTWEPADFNATTYMGLWDASTNSANISDGTNGKGEYYIVSVAGSRDLGSGVINFQIGDWVIHNGIQFEKLDNTIGVRNFNGRAGSVMPAAGDYTWAQIDKSSSSLGDIADVDMTGIAPGKILKWDGSNWIISDDISSGGASSVTSFEIQDGTIASGDLDTSLNTTLSQVEINKTNITSNTAGILNRLALAGGTMSGVLNMGNQKITNVANPTALTDVANKSYVDSAVSGLGAGDITEVVAGAGLLGGATTGSATLNVDVGTTANKIVQLDSTGKLPAVDGSLLINLPVQTDSSKLPLTGGTMSGDINMGGRKISSVGSPTLSTDVTTKSYVDNQMKIKVPSHEVRSFINNQENSDATLSSVHANNCGAGEVYVALEGLTDENNDPITDMGFCLEQNLRVATSWGQAKSTCEGEGKRLPREFEWIIACQRKAALGLNGHSTNWEWLANYKLDAGDDAYLMVASEPWSSRCTTQVIHLPNIAANPANSLTFRCAK